MKRAIVAYSFGGSTGRPGPSNVALGQVIDRLVGENDEYVVVAQDYLALCVKRKPDFVVGEEGVWLSTERITNAFTPYLKEQNISDVLLVAHSFLHWRRCHALLKAKGFTVERIKTHRIPFDPDCEHWWVHSPLQLLCYAVLQFIFWRQNP